MTPLGWVFLLTSLAFVWSLTLWCFSKVLSLTDDPTGSDREGA